MFTINVVGFDLHFADMAAFQARILVLCGREELDTAQGEELRELYNIVHWVMWEEEEEAAAQRLEDAQDHEAQLLRGSDALS